MGSQETRSDANKALYYNIYSEILEKAQSGHISGAEQKIMNEAKGILDMYRESCREGCRERAIERIGVL